MSISFIFEAVKTTRRNNLILLIGIHLMLFVYPMVSKTIHTHHDESPHAEHDGPVSFTQPEKECPVCDFEFYRFISTPKLRPYAPLTGLPVYNSPMPEARFTCFVRYFSLRAPPSACPIFLFC